ncbi:MAG TPA: alpha/beta hydrolase [Candidatus Andersenbacteria bacterium]|nr:alpha/beta hydrolase [Candidatus Andersenbacteria bacterium]
MQKSYVILPDLPGYGESEAWDSTPHISKRIIMENFISLYTTNPFECAKKITATTKIIAGTKDRLSPQKSMEKLQQIIPHATNEYVKGEGHIMPLEAPKKLGRAIQRFIESSPA